MQPQFINATDRYFHCLKVGKVQINLILDARARLLAAIWTFRTAEEMESFTAAQSTDYIYQVPGYRILLVLYRRIDPKVIPRKKMHSICEDSFNGMIEFYTEYKIKPNKKSYDRYRINNTGE